MPKQIKGRKLQTMKNRVMTAVCEGVQNEQGEWVSPRNIRFIWWGYEGDVQRIVDIAECPLIGLFIKDGSLNAFMDYHIHAAFQNGFTHYSIEGVA